MNASNFTMETGEVSDTWRFIYANWGNCDHSMEEHLPLIPQYVTLSIKYDSWVKLVAINTAVHSNMTAPVGWPPLV